MTDEKKTTTNEDPRERLYGFRCPACGEEVWAAKPDAKLGCQEGHALALVERAPELDEDDEAGEE